MVKGKVVIVDPFSTGALYAQKFHELGHQCYAVLANSKMNASYFSFDNTYFVNKTMYSVQECQEELHKDEVLAVVIGSETGVIIGEQLADYFGVAGNSITSSLKRRDKFVMQNSLKEHGLKHIRSQLITTNDGHVFDSENGYILKPVNSAGSDGVMFFANKTALYEHIKGIDYTAINALGIKNDSYIVQSFERGDEFVVDMVVQDDDIFICSLCIYKKSCYNGSRFVYENMQMLDIADKKYEAIIQYATQCVKALDVRFGPVHMELLAQSSTDGYINPIMIEIGARLHGGVAPIIFEKCYRPNLLELSVANYLNQDLTRFYKKVEDQIFYSEMFNKAKVVFLINSQKNGKLDERLFLSKIQSLPSFYQVKIIANGIMPITVDLLTCPVLVCLVGKTSDVDENKLRTMFNESIY
ncbi:ATP-grasp domain-containing protein [Moraxella sp. Tifton1]|uniref:ATP-grasp domain-containing protein n=1 Tax=Moraxella oculi TaxID=2940516 RepID=A0ABW8U7J0_9GAMM|nr:ATP-grasp domain-containing protein [Moraxella sp. Tifton1]MCL1623165.1 ATP-grasp domain-containing protein [Moraxella sp. Tifton1]